MANETQVLIPAELEAEQVIELPARLALTDPCCGGSLIDVDAVVIVKDVDVNILTFGGKKY